MIATRKTAGEARRAFTLTELLIVMAIVALLAAIGVPAYHSGMAMARQAICAGNLRALGSAFASFEAAVRSPAKQYEGTLGSSWAGLVFPYVSYNSSALICPEATPTNEPATPKFTKRYWGSIEWDFFNFDPVWERSDYAEFWYLGTVPTMWKLNEEDYQTWLAHSSVGWGVMSRNKDWLPRYTPGNNPNRYWIVFEDGGGVWTGANGGGHDYRDYAVHVVERGPNSYDFTFFEFGSSDANHGIVDANGLDIWIEEGSGDSPEGVGPFYFSDPPTNYGMNVNTPPPSRHLVLLLDYETHVCQVAAEPDSDEAFEENVAPRHLGKCNVLFSDGAVRALAPADFTPRNAAHYGLYWADAPE